MHSSTLDIYERYGVTGELIFENAVQKLLDGRASVEEAMDYIMEFARGSWTLVIDENLESLADALAELNYGVRVVPKGMSDDHIRRKYGDRGVFITSDDGDFSLDEVPDPFEDGMILVPNCVDEVRLARAIERVLMTWRKRRKAAPVAHRIARGDI
jgi:hypothetical protein